jgi:hypothetical protein
MRILKIHIKILFSKDKYQFYEWAKPACTRNTHPANHELCVCFFLVQVHFLDTRSGIGQNLLVPAIPTQQIMN